MGSNIVLTADDGHRFTGYESRPKPETARPLILVQEIFGLNHHIRTECDRFAGFGFHVIAPALFDRASLGIELAYSQADLDHGRAIRLKIKWEDTLRDIAAARAALGSPENVGVIGYCWGGSVAWLAATRLAGVKAAVCYYAAQIAPNFADEIPHCPVLMHFADDDPWLPLSDIEKIRQVQRDRVTIHVYRASHGFNCDERENFDRPSAALARERTLDFLKRSLAKRRHHLGRQRS